MVLELQSHHFFGDYPIMVIDFLTKFVREANIQERSETQAFVAVPSFLKRFSKTQYEADVEMGFLEEEGVSSWPEAVRQLPKFMLSCRESVQQSSTSEQCPKDL